jgi:hypothetical protein
MHVARWAVVAVSCALAVVPAALGQPAATAAGQPPPAAKDLGAWPSTVSRDKAEPPAATAWPAQDIALARARCAALLRKLDLVAVPEQPLREGAECGTPAPMRLVSIGSNPQVALSPPPVLTCDMIAALHKWLLQDVQPLARKHLGAPIVRVQTMSSYSCRNAYGRRHGRLSEHGRVNALDIGAFVTARGQAALVLADWGPNAREIAAKALEAQKQQAEAAAREKEKAEARKSATPIAAGVLRPSIAIGIPGIAVQAPSTALSTGLGLTQPTRLGGPKPAEAAARQASAPLGAKALFLRAIHRAACRTFSTVLGPEANSAHKNHFHVDMAERRHGSICE